MKEIRFLPSRLTTRGKIQGSKLFSHGFKTKQLSLVYQSTEPLISQQNVLNNQAMKDCNRRSNIIQSTISYKRDKHIHSVAFFSSTSHSRTEGWTYQREKNLDRIFTECDPNKNSLDSQINIEKEMKVAIACLASEKRHDEIHSWIEKMSTYAKQTNNMQMLIPYDMAITFLVNASKERNNDKMGLSYLLHAEIIMEELLLCYQDSMSRVKNNGPHSKAKSLQKIYGDLILGWSNYKLEHDIDTSDLSNASKNHYDKKKSVKNTSLSTKIIPAKKAEDWLRRAVKHAQHHNNLLSNNEEPKNSQNKYLTRQNKTYRMRGPTSIMFGAVIDAHAKSREIYSAASAESVLSFLLDLRTLEKSWPKPNAVMYTSVIDAWSRSPQTDFAATAAERWLLRMEEEYDRGNEHAKPGVMAYGAVIMAHSRTAGRRKHGRRNSKITQNEAFLAEKVLFRLNHRNRKIKSQATDEAKDEIELMCLLKERVVYPDINMYNGIIDCWARQVGTGKTIKKDLQNAFKAESWLMLLLNCVDSKACESITDDDLNDYVHDDISDSESNKKLMIPSIISSGIIPDIVSFNSVINAYARIQNSRAAALKVDHLFELMENYSLEPTSVTYGSVIKSWGYTNSTEGAEKASKYLERYENVVRTSSIQPNVITYNATLNAWANCKRNDAIQKMYSIIQRMERVSRKNETNYTENEVALVPPDIVSYNTLLKACMSHENKHEAFQLILDIFFNKIMLKPGENFFSPSIEPDGNTYATILNCIKNCVEPKNRSEKNYFELCRNVFESCCHHGLVDKYVLSILRSALPGQDEFNSLVYGNADPSKSDIPRAWERNAKRSRSSSDISFGRSLNGPASKLAAYHSKEKKLSTRSRMTR